MTNRVALKAKSPSNAKIRRCVKFAAFLTSGNGVRGMIKILNNILTVPLDNDESERKGDSSQCSHAEGGCDKGKLYVTCSAGLVQKESC